MFDFCKHKKGMCDFSVKGIHCGVSKGESLIEDVVSCNGKDPKLKKTIRNSPQLAVSSMQ